MLRMIELLSNERVRNIFCAILCLALSSCASIPLSTMWQLRNTNIETLDPQEVEVALYVVEPFTFSSAILQIERKFTDSGENLKYNALLRDQGTISPKLPKGTLYFKLNEKQAIELEDLRTKLLARKQDKGSLSVNVGFLGCFPDDLAETITVSIYLKTRHQQNFIPFQKNQQFNNIKFPICGTTTSDPEDIP